MNPYMLFIGYICQVGGSGMWKCIELAKKRDWLN